jgi:hypothetical protein
MDHTHTRPAARIHVSGDPKGGWIAEANDHSEPVTLQTEEPHPATAADVLDLLAQKYQSVKDTAIEGWDELRDHFLAAWDEKYPDAAQAAEPEPAPQRPQGQTQRPQQPANPGGE